MALDLSHGLDVSHPNSNLSSSTMNGKDSKDDSCPPPPFLFGCEMYQIHPQCPVWVYLKLLLFEKNSVIRVFSIVYEKLVLQGFVSVLESLDLCKWALFLI